jgi:diadenosine tetraphosphate (Ap4A) HIT family hydrolase
LPAHDLAESSTLLALEDIRPRAPLHSLIIPKAFLGSVFDLTKRDLPLLLDMQVMAQQLVHAQRLDNDGENYRLCFHIPPFHSVDHLHLHVLAPVSEMKSYYKYVKYNPKTRWCISLQQVMDRLQRGETAVPYRRPPCCPEQRQEH